jgi:photosystem II stability/assembly factor-like uncharacterized protein
MTYKNILAILLLQLIAAISFGQEGTFTTIERKIENRVPKSEMTENKGWKAEHRWLDEFKKRVDPNGNFYDGEVFYKEAERLAKLKKENTQKMAGWVPVGPTERASSSLTKGMGRINCIAFHPTDASTYWVGVAQGGVWKTTDSGQNWTPLTDDLPILRISDIAVDPNNPDNIYISVGDYAYIDVALSLDDRKRHSHYGIGVYRTTDGGTSWNPTGLTYQLTQLDGSLMRRVFIDPANADNLVAAGTGGIWTSSDAGANWTSTSDSLIWDIEADPNNPYTLYASSGHLRNSDTGTAGIMKSVDFGATWSWLSTGIPTDGSALRIEIAVAPTNSNHIYAIACNDESGFYGLYSSVDGGVNWTYSDAGGKNILEWYSGSGPGGQGWYDLSILVDPNDEMTVYTGGVNIWASSDGGVNFDGVSIWYDGAGPGLHADQHQFKYNALDDKFYVCNDGGLVRTDTIIIGSWDLANQGGYQWPTSWEYMSDGMQTSSFYTVSVSEGNPGNFISGAQDNSTYYNNGGNWSNLFGGDGMDCLLHPVDPDVIFGSSQYGRILYSDNGGGSYIQMNAPSGEDGEWVTPFMYEPGNTDVVYGGFGNLHTAYPGTDFNYPLSTFNDMPGAGFPSPISNFNVAESDVSTIYVAKRIYHSYNQLSEFWATDDGGATWSNKTSGLPDSMYFTHVEIDNDNALSVWVGVAGFEDGKHIYHSVDGGDNWTNISLDLPNLPVNCIVHRDESVLNTIYAGTDIGVYYTNDTMTGWLSYNQSLPNVIVSDLEINYGENKLYAATFGRGVWKTDLISDSLSNIGLNEPNPFKDATLDLYPNPNSGEFTLSIQEFEGNKLSMEIINVMGETIESQELGINGSSFEKTFDFNLSNGMYFLKVSSGNSMQTVRFVVK